MGPEIWIDDYAATMEIPGATELVAMWYFLPMMKESTHIWIKNLPKGSINLWEDMRKHF
jgi:hypothetical protein